MANIKDKLTEQQLFDLVNRRRKIKDIANELGVTPNYLGKVVKERAPKVDAKNLRKVRMLFQHQVAKEVCEGKRTVKEGAKVACVSERTMFRRMSKVRNATRPL